MAPIERLPGSDQPLVARIQGEYGEMPGLSLTAPQASRLWATDAATTARVLGALVEVRFLRRTAVGKYVRTTADPSTRG